MFPRFTGGAFDPIAPAMSAAQHAISQILDGQRAARLVAQHAVDPALPSLTDVLSRIVTATFDLDQIRAYRTAWGVFRDRRPDLYGPLLTLDGKTP